MSYTPSIYALTCLTCPLGRISGHAIIFSSTFIHPAFLRTAQAVQYPCKNNNFHTKQELFVLSIYSNNFLPERFTGESCEYQKIPCRLNNRQRLYRNQSHKIKIPQSSHVAKLMFAILTIEAYPISRYDRNKIFARARVRDITAAISSVQPSPIASMVHQTT